MKKFLVILIALITFSMRTYAKQLDIILYAEINQYYKTFNAENGLKEKKVSIGLSSDGSISSLSDMNGINWEIYSESDFTYIVKGQKKGKTIINKKYIISNDFVKVENLITKSTTEFTFEKNYKEIHSENFYIERKRNHLIFRNSKNIVMEYKKNVLISYFQGWNQSKIDYVEDKDKNYVYLWKTGPEDSWDAMYENSNVVYTKYEFSKDLRINLINYLILKDFDAVISKILFRDLFI